VTPQTIGKSGRIVATVVYGAFALYVTFLLRVWWSNWLEGSLTGGPTAFVVPVLVALMVLGPLLFALSWRGDRRVVPYAIGLASILSAIAFVVVPIHVERAWLQMTELLTTLRLEDPSQVARVLAAAYDQAGATQFLVCVAMSLVVPGVSLILGERWARREKQAGRGVGFSVVASASVGLLLWATAIGSMACFIWRLSKTHSEQTMEEGRTHLLESLTWLSGARLIVWVVASTATVALLGMAWRARHRNDGTSRAVEPIGLGCFGLGMLAWLLTRPIAYDAAHPPPAWASRQTSVPTKTALPERQSACLFTREVPVVEFAADLVVIDGTPAGRPGDDGAELREVLKVKASLWRALRPSKAFPGMVAFAVPSVTPMSAVRPFLDATRSAGFDKVDAWVVHPPRTFATRTRGTLVEVRPVCRVTFGLDAPLPPADTWGGLVNQM
jgi:MFS family permease